MFCPLPSCMLCKLRQLHCGRYHFCCESLGTRQSRQQNFPQHQQTPIGHPQRPRSGLSGRRKRQKFSSYLPKHFTHHYRAFVWRRHILCTVMVHKYGLRKSTKTSGDHFFYKSSFFFSRELAYVRINTSSNA